VIAENSGGWAFAESSNSLRIPAARQLSVSSDGSGLGIITSAPTGIDCGQTCSFGAYQGDQFTLTATPEAHSEFTGWSGPCSGAGTCEVTLGSADLAVTATFTKVTHPVSVTVTGAGSVSAESGSISGCTERAGTCSGTYDEGSEVSLTAISDPGSEFTGWSGGGCSGAGSCLVTLGEDTSVVANFIAKPSDAGGSGGSLDQPAVANPTGSSNPPGPPASTPKHATKKPPHCKKGFRTVKRKGKARCVKVKARGKKTQGKHS
jgi:hypothetical protein